MNFHPPPFISSGTMKTLQDYHWPGNVRELENVVERALIRNNTFASESWLQLDRQLLEKAQEEIEDRESPAEIPIQPLDNITRRHIEQALNFTHGRVHGEKGAAALLKIHPSTLRKRMDKLGVAYGRRVRVN